MENNKHHEVNEQGFYKYAELNQFESPISFYDNVKQQTPNNIEASFDGYQYHILCREDFYNFCFKGDHESQEELSRNLTKLNSPRINYKYFLRVLLFLILLAIPLGISSKFLIFSLPYEEQRSIVSILYLLLGLYLVGHIFRVFFTKKYKVSKYYCVFNMIKNQNFIDKRISYFHKHTYPYASVNPMKGLFLKNLFRTAFIVMIGYGLYISLMYVGTGDFIMKTQQRQFHDIAKFIFPIEVTTNYELSNEVATSSDITGWIKGDGNYIIERYKDYSYQENNYKIRDMNYSVIIDSKDLFEDQEYAYPSPIKNDIIAFSHMHQEFIENQGWKSNYEYVFYNLKTDTEITRILSDDETFMGLDYFELISIDVDDDRIFVLAMTAMYGEEEKSETYKVYEVIGNEFHLLRNLPKTYVYQDIDCYNDELYFTYFKGNESRDITYLGKGSINSHDFTIASTETADATRLIEQDSTLYIKGGGLYKVNSDFTFTTLALDAFNWSLNTHTDGLFILGSQPDDLQVVDQNGEYVIKELPTFNFVNDNYIGVMEGSELQLITKDRIYTFTQTESETPMYKELPDMEGFFLEYDVTHSQMNTYIWTTIIFFVTMPYIRSLLTITRKNKNSLRFTKEMY